MGRPSGWLILALALGAGTGVALAQEGALTALAGLRPGNWELHEIGHRTGARSICLRDPRLLFQIQHDTTACSRYVIDNRPHSATVNYTCPGLGTGRTTITVEYEGVVRLQTQGLDRGAPFDLDYEARRTGDCVGSH